MHRGGYDGHKSNKAYALLHIYTHTTLHDKRTINIKSSRAHCAKEGEKEIATQHDNYIIVVD